MNLENKKSKLWQPLLLVAIAIISVFLAFRITSEPSVPSDVTGKIITMDEIKNKDKPSVDMVMSHVYNISQKPHRSGSKEILRVRKYIIDEIEKMGLKYEIQDFNYSIADRILQHYQRAREHPEKWPYYEGKPAEGYNTWEEYIVANNPSHVNFQNILVRIGAKNPKNTFLMMAHYDSNGNSPGAGDDGISIAALLETMRVLNQNPDTENAIYFLLTDGEEDWLVGAKYFVENPLFDLKKLNFFVNLESFCGRGVPLIATLSNENDNNDKNILKMLSKNLRNSWSFSFFTELFKFVPHEADSTLLYERGIIGVDIASLGGLASNHQPSDSYENLSKSTANQTLKTTIDLADYFKTVDNFDVKSDENAVVFPYWSGKTIVLSNLGMKIFAVIVSVLALTFIVFVFIKKQVKVKDFLVSLGLILFNLVLAYPIMLFSSDLQNIFPFIRKETIGLAIIAAFSLIIMLLFGFVAKKILKVKNSGIKFAIILMFALISLATAIWFNSASYIFSIPLLLMLAAFKTEMIFENRTVSTILRSLLILVTCIIFIPAVVIIQMAAPYYIFAIFAFSVLALLPILSAIIGEA